MGKRYVKNLFPIAGVRWSDGNDVDDAHGVIFVSRQIDSDTDRSTIADQQYFVNWNNFKTVIKAQIGAEANTASNQGTGTGLFRQKTLEDLEFKSLAEGTGIVLADSGTEVSISINLFDDTLKFPQKTTVQRNALTPTKGDAIYNTDTDVLEYYDGTGWKTITAT